MDEVGYLTYGTDAANVLYHVVNARHLKRRAMIFTTNKPLDAWGRVLHDPDLAVAIVDRVLERGRLLKLDGPSMRSKHLGVDDPLQAELSPVHQPDRISGISPAEFPEPTAAGGRDMEQSATGIASSAVTTQGTRAERVRVTDRGSRAPAGLASHARVCRQFERWYAAQSRTAFDLNAEAAAGTCNGSVR